MFNSNIQGTLINLQEDEQTRYQCEVWFDYTRKNMERLREGSFLAIPNFSSNAEGYRYTILEVVSILPVHYGLGENAKGYPGFVREAAKSAFTDWREQEDEVREDTTQIRAIAVPANLEVNEEEDLSDESNLPMPGGDVHLVDAELTREIANLGIKPTRDDVIKAGHLIREQEVETYILVEEFFKVHFGIFGFTGAGKSNLLSTLIAKLFHERKNRDPIKVVFFDLMSEYSTLSLDLLVREEAYLIGLGPQTFPGEAIAYLSGQEDKLEAAAQAMAKTSLLPKALKGHREELVAVYRQLLEEEKILVYQQVDVSRSLGEFVSEYWSGEDTSRFAQKDKPKVGELIAELSKIQENILEVDVKNILARLEGAKKNLNLGANASKAVEGLYSDLKKTWEDLQMNPSLSSNRRATVPWISSKLNDPERDNLFIIQAHEPDELRLFSNWLGNRTYEERRRRGQISPLVSFVFDEADEFIPQDKTGTYKDSTEIAMTLARRGRKFGLGIGIATQRITYLDTSILAQPHTYFVSKLPRKSDQDRIREAFGVSDEMFRQTVKFKKGDWLLVSYDATGLEAVPLPIHTPDANVRLKSFLKYYQPGA
jgi:hypothetical protein